ncbi:MAG: hypothetical protein QM820_12525 [Minicystis sp.]
MSPRCAWICCSASASGASSGASGSRKRATGEGESSSASGAASASPSRCTCARGSLADVRSACSVRFFPASSSERAMRAISAPRSAPCVRAAGVGAARVSASRTSSAAAHSPSRARIPRTCRCDSGEAASFCASSAIALAVASSPVIA